MKRERAQFAIQMHWRYLFYLTKLVVPYDGRYARGSAVLDCRTIYEFICFLDTCKSQQVSKQPTQYREVVQAVWGEKKMQDGNAQEEVRQERIRTLVAKRADEVERMCAISNAAHKTKHAAIVKAARLAKSAGCPPCAN